MSGGPWTRERHCDGCGGVQMSHRWLAWEEEGRDGCGPGDNPRNLYMARKGPGATKGKAVAGGGPPLPRSLIVDARDTVMGKLRKHGGYLSNR